MQRVKVL
jgi:hypothetical protein